MIIKNYIRANNEFVPLKEFTSIVPDEDYIEGVIEMEWKNYLFKRIR